MLKNLKQKTLETVKVSQDSKTLTYRPLGRLRSRIIRVGDFAKYRGRTLIVESIDRETLEVHCTDCHGADYYVNALSFD